MHFFILERCIYSLYRYINLKFLYLKTNNNINTWKTISIDIKELRNMFRTVIIYSSSILLHQDSEYLPYKWQHYAPSTALLLSLLIVVKKDGESCASAFNISNTYRSRLCAAREVGWRVTSGRSCLHGWFADSSLAVVAPPSHLHPV